MSKPSLILIGAGGHARSCIDVIEQQCRYQIAGLVGLPNQMHAQQLDYSVIGADSDLPELAKMYTYALITIGQIQTADHRIRLYHQAQQLGFTLPVIIAPTAHVSRHASIGAGTIVMHGAIVNAGAKIGNNCIINNRALIEHDVKVEDHCHISTGAILNGDVTVGTSSFIGSGSVIKEGISAGKGCMIGLGLTVRHNISDHAHFIGHDKQ
ncbi:MAG TPA: acetyltransferase [Burkholderiaceae bacterium]|jgi:sugar O-acyltransferase (sialic acid O-acetyltransferase NeuD family)